MLVELWPISRLGPYPGNPRVNDDAVAVGLSRLWWLAVSFAMFASAAFSGCGSPVPTLAQTAIPGAFCAMNLRQSMTAADLKGRNRHAD